MASATQEVEPWVASFPYGDRRSVEVVNTRDLSPGDLIWYGQGWARVLDTKQESEIEGGHVMENQCAVRWRALDDPSRYTLRGYSIFGDVILRVIPGSD